MKFARVNPGKSSSQWKEKEDDLTRYETQLGRLMGFRWFREIPILNEVSTTLRKYNDKEIKTGEYDTLLYKLRDLLLRLCAEMITSPSWRTKIDYAQKLFDSASIPDESMPHFLNTAHLDIRDKASVMQMSAKNATKIVCQINDAVVKAEQNLSTQPRIFHNHQPDNLGNEVSSRVQARKDDLKQAIRAFRTQNRPPILKTKEAQKLVLGHFMSTPVFRPAYRQTNLGAIHRLKHKVTAVPLPIIVEEGTTRIPFSSGIRYDYQVNHDTPQGQMFHRYLQSGKLLLWTWDKHGTLSIGDANDINKHAIVAQGLSVRGAGEVQFHINELPRLELDIATCRAMIAKEQGKLSGDVPRVAGEDDNIIRDAIDFLEEDLRQFTLLRNRCPPDPADAAALPGERSQGLVYINFSSGHYCPSGNHLAAVQKWRSIGYRVQWSDHGIS